MLIFLFPMCVSIIIFFIIIIIIIINIIWTLWNGGKAGACHRGLWWLSNCVYEAHPPLHSIIHTACCRLITATTIVSQQRQQQQQHGSVREGGDHSASLLSTHSLIHSLLHCSLWRSAPPALQPPPPPPVFGAAGHTAQCVWLKDCFPFFWTPAWAFLLFFSPLLPLITKPHCFIYAWYWKWMKCFHSIREGKTIQG